MHIRMIIGESCHTLIVPPPPTCTICVLCTRLSCSEALATANFSIDIDDDAGGFGQREHAMMRIAREIDHEARLRQGVLYGARQQGATVQGGGGGW